MFYSKGLAKVLLILAIAFISIRKYGKNSDNTHDKNIKVEDMFVILYAISGILYEIGRLMEVNFKFKKYFNNVWNLLDAISYILIYIWMSILSHPGNFVVGRVALAISAIPLSLGVLQYLASVKFLGELVIMMIAMTADLLSFAAIFIACIIGFDIAFLGMFNGEPAFRNAGTTVLTLFSASLGNYDFQELFTSYDDKTDRTMHTIASTMMIVYVTMTAIVLLNLLIARMSSTLQRIESRAFEEWSFTQAQSLQQYTLINEHHSMCMLPPPLNLLLVALHRLHNIFLKKDGSTCLSLTGTLSNIILRY